MHPHQRDCAGAWYNRGVFAQPRSQREHQHSEQRDDGQFFVRHRPQGLQIFNTGQPD